MPWFDRRSMRPGHPDDARSAFGVDYARIIHSSSFRRLQGKTQILAINDGDFHRTRLTHSLEVAQIAEGMLERLERDLLDRVAAAALPPLPLIRAVALAHDLGHPPFGHSGEIALNYAMRDHGGFEGNGQTLRILARLENYSDACGADLTRRTLLGLIKYPVPYSQALGRIPALMDSPAHVSIIDRAASKPPKCYLDDEIDVVDWVLAELPNADREQFSEVLRREGAHSKPKHRSLDCSIMEVADDVAYGVHDLEDAIALGLISSEQLSSALSPDQLLPLSTWLGGVLTLDDTWYDGEGFISEFFKSDRSRKRMIGLLVHYFVGNVILETRDEFQTDLLKHRAVLRPEARRILDSLQEVVAVEVISSAIVQQLEFKGRWMVASVFDAYRSDPKGLLPKQVVSVLDHAGERAICDHIASMSDAALVRAYDRLYSPRMGSAFDKW